jgi:hypothetical protein
MANRFWADIEAIGRGPAVPTILDVVCRTVGMGFATVATVTGDSRDGYWRQMDCLSVRDDIAFGLQPGSELKIDTMICNEIREHGEPVIIENVAGTRSTAAIKRRRCMVSRATYRFPLFCRTGRFSAPSRDRSRATRTEDAGGDPVHV